MMLSRTNSEPGVMLTSPSYRRRGVLNWPKPVKSSGKQQLRSPLLNMHPYHSCTSLSSSVVSADVPEPEPEAPPMPTLTPPPEYDDPRHPWSRRKIEPREEEGKEILPEYVCTVSQMNYVNVKCEMESPHKRSSNRAWKQLYVVLWGTCIKAYKKKPTPTKSKLVWSYSMADVQVNLATDYKKYNHVVRLQIHEGPTFLFRAITEEMAVRWIDTVQASANIAHDIDVRTIPEFAIKRRRRAVRH